MLLTFELPRGPEMTKPYLVNLINDNMEWVLGMVGVAAMFFFMGAKKEKIEWDMGPFFIRYSKESPNRLKLPTL